jgi:hypothetical protein
MANSVIINRATPVSYRLVIPLLPSETRLTATKELMLDIFGVIIPTVTLDTTEERWQEAKMLMASGSVTFDAWGFSYIVDSNFKNWSVLFRWLTFINNNRDKMLERPQDYSVDCSLSIIDNFNKEVLRILFKNAWIQSLGEVSMSQREGESILESSSVLYFDRYEIQEKTFTGVL